MCRFPGCRRQAAGCDLDHTVPYPHGPTSAENVHALCRRHHRLKHEAGWQVCALPGGHLEWTSPLGAVYTTHPPLPGGEAATGRKPSAKARDDDDHDPPCHPYVDPVRYIDPQDWLDQNLRELLDEALLSWLDEADALRARWESPLAPAGVT